MYLSIRGESDFVDVLRSDIAEVRTQAVESGDEVPAAGQRVDFGLMLIDIKLAFGNGTLNELNFVAYGLLFVFETGVGDASGSCEQGKANHPHQERVTDAVGVAR